MQNTYKLQGKFLNLAAVLAIAGTVIAAQPAEAGFNESRWFLQNVCLANANQVLGHSEWTNYQREAKQSRARLRRAGVPERHLREMENQTTRMIRTSAKQANGENSPRLCIQWYKT